MCFATSESIKSDIEEELSKYDITINSILSIKDSYDIADLYRYAGDYLESYKILSSRLLEVKDESNPNGDIEIKYTGLRPGEKLYEELLIGDNVTETENPLIMRAEEDMLPWDELEPILNSLEVAIKDCDHEKLRNILIQVVPGFKPQCEIMDVLYNEI